MQNYLRDLVYSTRKRVWDSRMMKLFIMLFVVGSVHASASSYLHNGGINVKVEQLESSATNVLTHEISAASDWGNIDEKHLKQENQSNTRTITGKVFDEKGVGLPGVSVIVQGKEGGTVTDEKGKYSIKVAQDDALTFSFIGYKTEIILVDDKKELDVQMKSTTQDLGDVTVVAFGEQKKESVVGSITTVSAEDLKSSNSDLTSSFTGKIAGLIGWDQGGSVGALTEDEMNTKFYIRGITSYSTGGNTDPLILLDGIEVGKLDLARIDPEDIESFNVMKDASATAMYGARGANGVIYVKTKRGKEGNIRTNFNYSRIYSMPTDEIDVVSPKRWMELYNEASIDRGSASSAKYSRDKIQRTNNSNYPYYVYPGNDWYNMMFDNYTVNNHYNLSARGGGQKVQYYISFYHNRDNGIIKTDPLNQFDVNVRNQQTNFRVNITADISKSAKLDITSFSTYDDYSGTLENSNSLYYSAFNANPVDFPTLFPAPGPDETAYNWPHIRFGGKDGQNIDNPYARVHRGYKNRVRYSSVNQFELIQKLDNWVKGLEVRGKLAYSKEGLFEDQYTTSPALYTLRSYNPSTGAFALNPSNEFKDDSKLVFSGNTASGRTNMEFQGRILHTAAWDDHQTSFTGVLQTRQTDESMPTSLENSLPYRNLNVAFRGTYGYKDRYFTDVSLGINGSERFAPGERIGYFPAAGVAWMFSKENFMRSAGSWMHFGKLRFSYGRTGNDGVIRSPRYFYLETIVPESTQSPLGPKPNSVAKGSQVMYYRKDKTKWEINEQYNLGLDLKLFKGAFEMNIDAYKATRHNIYEQRHTLPASTGLFEHYDIQPGGMVRLVAYPLDHIGKVASKGIDFSGKVQHAFNNDFWFIVNGTFTYSEAKFLQVEEAEATPEWQQKKGNDISQQLALVAEGLFQDWEEIANSPTQSGDVMPGDIRFKDINGDGRIDLNDRVRAGYPTTPRVIYGMNTVVNYKDFEFSMAFQGTSNRTFFINPASISPLAGNKAVLKQIADSHWSSENQAERPFWPRLSDQNIGTHNQELLQYNSTYFMREGRFLRCKSLQLTYTMKGERLKKYKVDNIRLYVRTNNPFLFSSFKLWDVELGGNGFNYPIQKTYSIGASVTF